MRILLQRVVQASVEVGSDEVGRIDGGVVCLVGVAQGDTEDDVRYLVDKTLNLRIFADDAGKFNLSLLDVSGQVLAVSQFTLLADTRKGRRPSFTSAAPPAHAEVLFNRFVQLARDRGVVVQTGRFQQHMLVRICNDGPVTMLLDSRSQQAIGE